MTFDGPLSPVPFKGKTCRIAAVFNDSCSNAALFLCNPDCVAERLGFEPSLPFVFGAKSRWVRDMQRILQHIRLIRRIAEHPSLGKSSPFFYSAERRTPSDCRTENGHFEAPSVTNLVST